MENLVYVIAISSKLYIYMLLIFDSLGLALGLGLVIKYSVIFM